MKLYQSPGSPNARRVRFYVAERGLPIEQVLVDLSKKEQFSDAYRAIDPRLQVPALQLDDGTVTAEVPAIWQYLERQLPGANPLLGTDPRHVGLVAMWERRMFFYVAASLDVDPAQLAVWRAAVRNA